MSASQTQTQSTKGSSSLFFIALVVGIGAIITLKTSDADQLIVTAIPVAIMLIYAASIYFFRSLRLRLDQAGDNLYYLGFLYTLSSLAFSLYEFGGNVDAASSIITNFGIAIWTTIAGLGLRVLFSQLRSDPVETEHLARVELADASRHLRTELDVSAREFSMFRRSLQQMIAETFQDLQGTIDEQMKSGLDRFDDSIQRFAKSVEEANSRFEDSSIALSGSADMFAGNMSHLASEIENIDVSGDFIESQIQPVINKIDDRVDQLVVSISEASQRIGNISIPEDQIIRKLQPAIDKITEAAEAAFNVASVDSVRADSWSELAGEVSIVMSGIGESLTAAKKSSDEFASGAEAMQTASNQMSSIAEQMKSTDHNMAAIANSADREVKRVVESILKNLEGLSHQLSVQISNSTIPSMTPSGSVAPNPGVQWAQEKKQNNQSAKNATKPLPSISTEIASTGVEIDKSVSQASKINPMTTRVPLNRVGENSHSNEPTRSRSKDNISSPRQNSDTIVSPTISTQSEIQPERKPKSFLGRFFSTTPKSDN
jgi:methyl-accepting chemotaxis protein